jgi:hypothetical protein
VAAAKRHRDADVPPVIARRDLAVCFRAHGTGMAPATVYSMSLQIRLVEETRAARYERPSSLEA